jgi:hypothetical protein
MIIFTVSDSEVPNPGGSGPRIYILRVQGGRVITPGAVYRENHREDTNIVYGQNAWFSYVTAGGKYSNHLA